jgi:hypothetical protein
MAAKPMLLSAAAAPPARSTALRRRVVGIVMGSSFSVGHGCGLPLLRRVFLVHELADVGAQLTELGPFVQALAARVVKRHLNHLADAGRAGDIGVHFRHRKAAFLIDTVFLRRPGDFRVDEHKGLLHAYDGFGIGFYYYNWSNALEQTLDPLLPLDSEKGLEVYYNLAVTPWFILTADLQVIDPGKANFATETVAALRAKFSF